MVVYKINPVEMIVMFVDDDAISNEINQMLLRKLYPNIEVIIKNSVDKALDYLKDSTSENPNKIFLDINLPVKNGWDFLIEFKDLNLSGIDLYMLTSALDLLNADVRTKYPEVKGFVEKPLYDYKLDEILNC
ncbi:MAG: response regulator [Cyclobacteriaceae bacterium]|nr:response regulator [Cyclobacteriaceae bacterium]